MSSREVSILRILQFFTDIALLAFSFYFAYLLRFEFSIPDDSHRLMWEQLPLFVGVSWLVLMVSGAYRRAWRYVSLVDMPHFLYPLMTTGMIMVVLRLTVTEDKAFLRFPLSVTIMSAGLAFLLLMGIRILWRLNCESIEPWFWPRRAVQAKQRREAFASFSRLALIGAGDAGVMAAREFRGQGRDEFLAGFFDDERAKTGQYIAGLKVLGTTEDLPALYQRGVFEEAIITIGSPRGKDIARIARICEQAGIPTRVIPPLGDLLTGKVSITHVRPVSIEDLLGRDEVKLDIDAIRAYVSGRRILVTGAGGSIGSELARQIIRFAPEKLIMLDHSEFALFEIDRELNAAANASILVPVVADVRDRERICSVFRQQRPHAVFHAAAFKHVPMMEQNVVEAVHNNVIGTHVIAGLAGDHRVEVFVNISTDKAVNPTSVMGASKRLAEIVVQDLTATYPQTRFESVRFGNVLGSTGSVIPLFKEQIANGGPVRVTHPDMRRYFMTIPEAAQLVLQSATLGQGGEIFVLDMGEPVKIIDLAHDLIRLSGFRPGEDIKIEFTGMRPGEKLFEELSVAEENTERTRHPKIFTGRHRTYPPEQVKSIMAELTSLIARMDDDAMRQKIQTWIPEFQVTSIVNSSSCINT